NDLSGSVIETFRGWWTGTIGTSQMQSCPSAHTATAVGFALALCSLFPSGRWLFLGVAGFVGLQRLESGAHYLSDIFWGAAVGYAIWLVLFRPGAVGGWFSRRGTSWHRTRGDAPGTERLSVLSRDD